MRARQIQCSKPDQARAGRPGEIPYLEYQGDILVALGIGGLLASLVLAWALIAATRRQTEHFRSLAKEAGRDRIAISDATGDKTTGPVVLEDAGDGAFTGRHTGLATSLHNSADEEDPQPSGFEIR